MNTSELSKKLLNLILLTIAAILVILMTTGCSVPVTARIAEPQIPDFSHLKFTPAELQALQACTKEKTSCTVPRSIITKYADKLTLYKGYARECKASMDRNNRLAK